MKKIIYAHLMILLFLVFTSFLFGQKNDSLVYKPYHELSFDLGAGYTPLLNRDFFGINLNIKYYPMKEYATGIEFSYFGKNIADTFSYKIGNPLINFFEIAWINQYDLLQTDKIRIGINCNNGITISRLGDDDLKEKYWTKYGYRYRSKEIAINYFYLIEPGIDVSLKVYSMKHYPDFYLTAKAKYRFVFGDTNYSSLNQFSNYLLALGISIIGFTDEDETKLKNK